MSCCSFLRITCIKNYQNISNYFKLSSNFFQIWHSQILDPDSIDLSPHERTASGAHLMEISRLEGLTTALYAEAKHVPSEFRPHDVYCIHTHNTS
jgi:hypothetical protein